VWAERSDLMARVQKLHADSMAVLTTLNRRFQDVVNGNRTYARHSDPPTVPPSFSIDLH
jgi:hypothetical protein